MNNTTELLCWLQKWFYSNCDGDWEHNQNVIITTIDNPGWGVTINLEGTEREGQCLNLIRKEESESDWYYCRADGNKFESDCGPFNLSEVLQIFRNWVEKDSEIVLGIP